MNNLTEKWTKDTSEVICSYCPFYLFFLIAHFKILIVDNMLVTSKQGHLFKDTIVGTTHTRSVLILNVGNVEK